MSTRSVVDMSAIARAVDLLRQGRLVAIPTETVYGLAANASNPDAVRRIFDTKGRPRQHPVIVHIADTAPIDRALAGWAKDIPTHCRVLAEAFWPGPLTMILKRGPKAHDGVTGGRDTVGVRVPSHPWALSLVRAFGDGVAAPSANKFGRISPTTAAHVHSEFGSDVDLVLDGGPCTVGVESTIIDLSTDTPRLLRPGAITRSALEAVLGCQVEYETLNQAIGDSEAPGTLESHYAPRALTHIMSTAQVKALRRTSFEPGTWPGVLSFQSRPLDWPSELWRTLPATPQEATRSLYAALRRLDERSPPSIHIEAVPDTEPWTAMADRIQRASAPREIEERSEIRQMSGDTSEV